MTEYPDIDLHRLIEAMAPLVPEASDWWIPAHRVPWPRLNAEIDGVRVRMNLRIVHQTVFRRARLDYTVIGESPGELRMRVSSSRVTPETWTQIQTAFTQIMHRWGLLNPWYGMALLDAGMLREMRRWRRAGRAEKAAILAALKPRFLGSQSVPVERTLHLRKLLDDYVQWSRNWMRWDRVTHYRGHHQPVGLESVSRGLCPTVSHRHGRAGSPRLFPRGPQG